MKKKLDTDEYSKKKTIQVTLVVKNLLANAGDIRDAGSISGSERSPGERKWLTTPVFLPREPHGPRNLAGRSP